MAHLRVRILPTGFPLVTVVSTIGGSSFEEPLDGFGTAEVLLGSSSIMRLNLLPQHVEFISEGGGEQQRQKDEPSENSALGAH